MTSDSLRERNIVTSAFIISSSSTSFPSMAEVAFREPRLSTRSCQALFQEGLAELEELEHTRRTTFAEYSNRTAQANFSIEMFQQKGLISSSAGAAEQKAIRDTFRFFVQQVGIIADGGAQEQHAARTMYNNIVRQKESRDLAYNDAISYFGKIAPTKFDLIRNAALDLFQASVKAKENSEKSSAFDLEFGLDVIFNVRELIDDTASGNYSLFPSSYDHSLAQGYHSDMIKKISGDNSAAKELLQLCGEHVRASHFSMEPERLAEEILKLLHDTTASDEITQAKLFELVGETGFEFMFEIMQEILSFRLITIKDLKEEVDRQSQLLSLSQAQSALLAQSLSRGLGGSDGANTGLFGMMTPSQTAAAFPSLSDDLDLLSLNQRRKREKKEKERIDREAGSLTSAMQDPSMAWLIEAGFSEVNTSFVLFQLLI